MKTAKKHPLDGYDFTADVPAGTPLLVQGQDGRVWRLARKGVRYHSDVSTRLHGARPARAPASVAASTRIRALLESCLGAGDLPAGVGAPVAVWRDAPHAPGSLASTPELALHADGWVRGVVPVHDDAPRTGARQLGARELAALQRDLAASPRGVRLPVVSVRERTVRVEANDPRAQMASALPGARATQTRRVYATESDYTTALSTPGARRTFDGGPVDVPIAGTAWDVPVTAWRAATAEAL
ncbi:MAG TPA: hypothetical protein VFP50_15295 [Anaeromyxobacteraceae bacterium]|nr:hypothetical protein [Anaeromyxobacteraceae bacterium]